MCEYKMKISIICGFLGVGKTTLLKNILAEKGPSVAVLINEFGEVGIDKNLVQSGTDVDITELPSGCICCTMRTNLVAAVQEIINRLKPDQLIIEPSGIATTSGVLDALSTSELSDKIVIESVTGIIDCADFLENIKAEVYGNYFYDQIANADVILLNKADLVTPEIIVQIQEIVEKYNKHAVILPSVFCKVSLPKGQFNERPQVIRYHFAPKFESFVDGITIPITREKVAAILQQIAEGKYGNIVRAKGIYQSSNGMENFDYVQGKISFGKPVGVDQTKFVFIGTDIDRQQLVKSINLQL